MELKCPGVLQQITSPETRRGLVCVVCNLLSTSRCHSWVVMLHLCGMQGRAPNFQFEVCNRVHIFLCDCDIKCGTSLSIDEVKKQCEHKMVGLDGWLRSFIACILVVIIACEAIHLRLFRIKSIASCWASRVSSMQGGLTLLHNLLLITMGNNPYVVYWGRLL